MEGRKRGRAAVGKASNEQFLEEVSELLGNSAKKGSLRVTMKHCDEGCLVRAQLGHSKTSTIVHSKDVVSFQMKLTQHLKASWGGALPKALSKRRRNAELSKKSRGAAGAGEEHKQRAALKG